MRSIGVFKRHHKATCNYEFKPSHIVAYRHYPCITSAGPALERTTIEYFARTKMNWVICSHQCSKSKHIYLEIVELLLTVAASSATSSALLMKPPSQKEKTARWSTCKRNYARKCRGNFGGATGHLFFSASACFNARSSSSSLGSDPFTHVYTISIGNSGHRLWDISIALWQSGGKF